MVEYADHLGLRNQLRSTSLTVFGALFLQAGIAQPTASALLVDPLLFSLSTFPSMTLVSGPETVRVTAELTVETQEGELEVTMRSAPFMLSSGISMLTPGMISVEQVVTAATERGRSLLRDQRLGGGKHLCCVEVTILGGGESGAPFCEPLLVEDLLWIDLVQPWDGDTIDETRPMLTWTAFSGRELPADVGARLVLAPLEGRQKAKAIASNVPLFVVDDLRSRMVPFPGNQPDLVPGRCYAWQVEAWRQDALVERTEPWRFCVRKTVVPVPDKYVLLRSDGGSSVYSVVDGYIYFRTDERYDTETVECSVLGPRGELIHPDLGRESANDPDHVQVGVKSAGVNMYELDLQPYALRNGTYTLVVNDAKKRRTSLKFTIIK